MAPEPSSALHGHAASSANPLSSFYCLFSIIHVTTPTFSPSLHLASHCFFFPNSEMVSLASSFTSGQPLHGWHIPGLSSECTSPIYPHFPSVVSCNPVALSNVIMATTPKLYPGQTFPHHLELYTQHLLRSLLGVSH